MKMNYPLKSIFCFIMVVNVSDAFAQDKPFIVQAKDKTRGYVQNTSSYTLTLHQFRGTYKISVPPNQTETFQKKDIKDDDRIMYTYDSIDYLLEKSVLYTRLIDAKIALDNKVEQLTPGTNLILHGLGFYIDLTRGDTVRLIHSIKNFWDKVDENYDIITKQVVGFLTRNETQLCRIAYDNFQANEMYYARHKSLRVQDKPILTEYKESPFYKTYNPRASIDFGWLLAKQKLNGDWTNKGTKHSFSINAMVAISPEINISQNVHSRLYLHGFYERLCFGLNKENSYALGPLYIKDASGGSYPLAAIEGIDLCLQQLGAGLDFSTIFKRIKVDFGGGCIYSQKGYLNFSSAVNYGYPLKTNKFTSVVSGSHSFPGEPYLTFALSIPSGHWLKSGGIRLAGTYQRMNVKSEKGLDIYRVNGSTPDAKKIDANLPGGGGLFTLKLCFGLAKS